MLAGKARVTSIDYEGKAFVDDIGPGDMWYFPSGIPHSIQGHPDTDGCEFLLVFDDGHFSEYETFLISEWVARTPKDVLAKNLNVSESALAHIPKEEQYIFFVAPFAPIEEERRQAAGKAGYSPTEVHLSPRRGDAERQKPAWRGEHRRFQGVPHLDDRRLRPS